MLGGETAGCDFLLRPDSAITKSRFSERGELSQQRTRVFSGNYRSKECPPLCVGIEKLAV